MTETQIEEKHSRKKECHICKSKMLRWHTHKVTQPSYRTSTKGYPNNSSCIFVPVKPCVQTMISMEFSLSCDRPQKNHFIGFNFIHQGQNCRSQNAHNHIFPVNWCN